MPYRNINSSSVTKEEKSAYPKILQLGSKKGPRMGNLSV